MAESVQCISISATWVGVDGRRVMCRRFDLHPSFKRRACEQDAYERGASYLMPMKLAYASALGVSIQVVFGCPVIISLFEANAKRAASFPF